MIDHHLSPPPFGRLVLELFPFASKKQSQVYKGKPEIASRKWLENLGYGHVYQIFRTYLSVPVKTPVKKQRQKRNVSDVLGKIERFRNTDSANGQPLNFCNPYSVGKIEFKLLFHDRLAEYECEPHQIWKNNVAHDSKEVLFYLLGFV